MRNQFTAILSMSALLVLWAQAGAVTVHTWRDSSGVTHFSDEPSPSGQTGSTLELDEVNKASGSDADDFYSIANQWKRMKAERDAASSRKLEKQKLRSAERERIAALELQASRQEESRSESYIPTYPIYRRGFGGRHIGNQYQLGYGQPGYHARGYGNRYNNRPADYHSPFHDRSQPQSVRPKSFTRNRNPQGVSTGRSRGRSHSQGGLYVQF